MIDDKLAKIIEELSLFFVLNDPEDALWLSGLSGKLNAITLFKGNQTENAISETAEKAVAYLGPVKTGGIKTGSREHEYLKAVIMEIQGIADGFRNTPAITAPQIPAQAGPAGLPGNTAEKNSGNAGNKPNDNLAQDASLVADFINESIGHLDEADASLLTLETNPADAEAINRIFRAFHTMKSLSGFLGFNSLFSLVKLVENLLSSARKKEISFSGPALEAVFRASDTARKMIMQISRVGTDGGGGLSEEIENAAAGISAICSGSAAAAGGAAAVNGGAPDRKAQAEKMVFMAREMIKVDPARLDRLVDIIGEVVIAQAMVSADLEAFSREAGALTGKISHLNKLTRMLHEFGLSLRLTTLKHLFQRLARLSRDLAKEHGKEITFTYSGETTELDRAVVEKIHDPLVHMLRNAIDHGIEKNTDRLKAGKHASGNISINAYHSGGSVFIEMGDDGAGLDKDAILLKGRELNLISAGAALTEEGIHNLIFEPGLSTAAAVTDTSGRGVGMDVVKKNIEDLGGRVNIRTEKGRSTVFTISLPLTTAIIEAIAVSVLGEKYFIPTLSIVESFKPAKENLITVPGAGTAAVFREEIIPVLSLQDYFSGGGGFKAPGECVVVVVESNGKKAGLSVDGLLEPLQIVVKSMGDSIEKIPGIAASTIMPDGRVGLIIDAAQMIKTAAGGGAAGIQTKQDEKIKTESLMEEVTK